jgi:3',5'-cyclic AMP phosphodiesterase CpdA
MMFVLAHLSDPHLAPAIKPRFAELLSKRAIGYGNWLRGRKALHQAAVLAELVVDLKGAAPDHIAVTGDLVNIALAGEFAPARAWLETLGSPDEVTVVPGNHDAYVRATLGHFHRIWRDYMRGDDADSGGPWNFPFVRRRGPLTLIGLSSAVPTMPFMATGRLGSDQIARLDGILGGLRDDGSFRVVLIHHPVLGRRSTWHKRLVDARSFRKVIARHGADLVLHGHDHVRSLIWLDGPGRKVPVVGVPSASALGEPHQPAAYNLYRVAGEPGRWHCEMVARGFSGQQRQVVELERRMLVHPVPPA